MSEIRYMCALVAVKKEVITSDGIGQVAFNLPDTVTL